MITDGNFYIFSDHDDEKPRKINKEGLINRRKTGESLVVVDIKYRMTLTEDKIPQFSKEREAPSNSQN